MSNSPQLPGRGRPCPGSSPLSASLRSRSSDLSSRPNCESHGPARSAERTSRRHDVRIWSLAHEPHEHGAGDGPIHGADHGPARAHGRAQDPDHGEAQYPAHRAGQHHQPARENCPRNSSHCSTPSTVPSNATPRTHPTSTLTAATAKTIAPTTATATTLASTHQPATVTCGRSTSISKRPANVDYVNISWYVDTVNVCSVRRMTAPAPSIMMYMATQRWLRGGRTVCES